MCSQFLIMHFLHVPGLESDSLLQPGHFFLSRKYPMHIPQFIPHGAISTADISEVLFKLLPVFLPDFSFS